MSYTQITARIIDQTVQLANETLLASGSVGVLQIRCNFCSLWDGYGKVAVFYRDAGEVYHIPLAANVATVPSELLEKPGYFFFGVMGAADNTRTTEVVRLKVTQGAITTATAEPGEPAPDIYKQILAAYGIIDATKQNKLAWATDEDIEAMFAGTYESKEDEDPEGDGYDAVTYTAQARTAEQKAQARENIGATTMEATVEKLCPTFTASGAVAVCEPVAGYPVQVASRIEPTQSGSGDPLPNNIRPISGHNEVKLTQSGKNLWTLENEIIIQEDPNSGWRTIYGLPVGVPLTVSADITKYADDTATNTRMTFYCHYLDGTRDWAFSEWANEDAERDGITRRKTATIIPDPNKTVSYYEVALLDYSDASGTRNAKAENIQIEVGTTATAYEPYKGDTFTMDLRLEFYVGRFDWATGVLTVDWFYEELDGVEKPFTRRATYGEVGDNYSATMTFQPSSRPQGNILCSHLKNICDVGAGYCYVYGYDSKDIIFNLNGWSVLDEANAWLAAQKSNGTPFQVCYELAEPITIQLTPQEITALSGTNILYSDTGSTEVAGRADPTAIINNLQNRLAAIEKAVVNNA